MPRTWNPCGVSPLGDAPHTVFASPEARRARVRRHLLFELARRSREDGFDPEDFHAAEIQQPIDDRLVKIQANPERMRWLYNDLPASYLFFRSRRALPKPKTEPSAQEDKVAASPRPIPVLHRIRPSGESTSGSEKTRRLLG